MQRDASIDRFRGFTILMMVIVNDIADIARIPAIFKHADDAGFTVADIVAPMFLFAVALTYEKSFNKKFLKGKAGAYMDTVKRYLALIGLGTIFSAGGAAVGQTSDWGVLQAIGAAGIITLIFIRLKPVYRLIVSIAVLTCYQFAVHLYLKDFVLGGSHGSIFGSISWGAMLLLMTVFAKIYWERQKRFVPAAALALLIAIGLCIIPYGYFILSKNRVSMTYVLLAAALCCIIFYAVKLLTEKLFKKPGFLCYWGENPITLYVAHLFLMGIMRIPTGFDDMGLMPGLLRTSALVALVGALAYFMHKKNIRISL
ncbi:MAG: heparan-alpha-glucosaminide N-acetyltransferase domain-containing protein [Oscillospiraceae bacterium]|nr:heparan-alpha-glucosaminide N-acetyltransferase domain-containing protein [Oscillospiraceae bacterium]